MKVVALHSIRNITNEFWLNEMEISSCQGCGPAKRIIALRIAAVDMFEEIITWIGIDLYLLMYSSKEKPASTNDQEILSKALGLGEKLGKPTPFLPGRKPTLIKSDHPTPSIVLLMKGGIPMQLSSQCASDDFEDTYNLYGDMIFKLCMVYLGNAADTEDVMHDVFIKFLNKSPKFKDNEHVKHWLIRVTINACKDKLRSYWKKNTFSLGDMQFFHQDQEDLHLADAIYRLNDKYKCVIHMYYFEGYSVQEISQVLNIGLSAVKMRLKRGREQLKIELEEHNYEER